jgi:antagonist of KipI
VSVLISKPGVLTTVQDLGRRGYRSLGINPNGAMDRAAARVANILVGNKEDAAVLEMHYPPAELIFEQDTLFSICGAEMDARLGTRSVRGWGSYAAPAGTSLSFASRISGNRTYIAVSGGIAVQDWLGSSSTNLIASCGGYEGRRLKGGDRLQVGAQRAAASPGFVGRTLVPPYSPQPTVRVIAGSEFDKLDDASFGALATERFTVGRDSDRMGYRLSGTRLTLRDSKEMVSSAVDFGTIQLLPDGQLVILMADHQTTGGYPRIGHVISVDVPLIAQLGPGDKIAFQIVSQQTAEDAVAMHEHGLNFLRVGCRFLASR